MQARATVGLYAGVLIRCRLPFEENQKCKPRSIYMRISSHFCRVGSFLSIQMVSGLTGTDEIKCHLHRTPSGPGIKQVEHWTLWLGIRNFKDFEVVGWGTRVRKLLLM